MALVQRAGWCARLAVAVIAAGGCNLSKPAVRQSAPMQTVPVAASNPQGNPPVRAVNHPQSPVQPVAFRLPAAAQAKTTEIDPLFARERELCLAQLMAEVEARNPSLQAMAYAWRAMAQRYPQAVSLDDPMFMTMVAPASFNSSTVQPAYVVSGTQKLPWFGKRDTRGQAARSEADAAFHDLRDTRLQVAQVTRIAFYDYYLVEREAELVGQNSRVMQEFRDSAQTKYENNQVTQQDVIQADVELADVERRQLEIDRMRRVAIARINTLLRQSPGEPLPPPPRLLSLDAAPPPSDSLQQMAATGRPDLSALAARVQAEEAALNLALKQYYPDAEFFGRYDSFWQPASTQSDLRAQVGMNMNVPIYRKKLQAAVCEAQFRLSQRRAEYQQRLLDVQFEVQSAYEQVQESRQAAKLYTEKYLPLAEQNLAAARSNYDFGKITFLSLAQAQRQLIEVREKYQQTITDYHRRLADLERAVGTELAKSAEGEEMPFPAR